MKKVFLGGTCNESKWRDEVISMLKIDYFNPVVEDWTAECQAEEIKQRTECDFVLYVITPKMTGVYSIAEVVDDSNKQPKKTIFVFLEKDTEEYSFTKGQIKSLSAVAEMVVNNGGIYFKDLKAVVEFLNSNSQIQKKRGNKMETIDPNIDLSKFDVDVNSHFEKMLDAKTIYRDSNTNSDVEHILWEKLDK